MKTLLIWDGGKKDGEVIADTKYLPEHIVNMPRFRIPLPPEMIQIQVQIEGGEMETTRTKYAVCAKSNLIVDDKVVCLCKEE